MEQWEYTAKICDMIFGALEKKGGIMTDTRTNEYLESDIEELKAEIERLTEQLRLANIDSMTSEALLNDLEEISYIGNGERNEYHDGWNDCVDAIKKACKQP